MSMRLGYGLTIEQTQKLTMTPELIQAIRILQFNTQELDSFVQEEILENPVLEFDKKRVESLAALSEQIGEDYADPGFKQWQYSKDKEEYSFEQFTSKEETLEDYLLLQLTFSSLKGNDLKVGRFLVEAINDNGYLTVSCEQVAKAFGISVEEVSRVLDVIQTFEPSGVGARDLKECLIIQLASKGLLDEVVEYVIMNHLQDLGENKLTKVAKTTGIPVSQIQMVGDLIRTLEPKPGRSFSSGENVKYIIPDIIVEKVNDIYVVANNEGSVPHLKVSSYYSSLSNQYKNDEELVKYLNERLSSAFWLIKSIEQRKKTIYNVANAVVEHQKEFFEKGSKYLKTLTLKQVAESVGMHESTVSRSVNGKFMQTPRGVFEIKYFFSSGITGQDGEGLSSNSIKTMIKEIIDNEDHTKPFSDQDIVGILSEKGIEISRRTVAKYREGMNILSSSKRRRY